jgi:hypothetical protein
MRPAVVHPLARVLLAVVVVFGLSVLLGGSSCIYHSNDDDYCDDDDFDDDDTADDDDEGCGDDDDSFTITTSSSVEDYRLENVRVEPAASEGLHPVGVVHVLEEVSIFDLWGPGRYGNGAFAELSDRYLAANPELLGLTDDAGRRGAPSVHFLGDALLVHYPQEVFGADGWREVSGAWTRFWYDTTGVLQRIENPLELHAAR